jgi:hypothetical protein
LGISLKSKRGRGEYSRPIEGTRTPPTFKNHPAIQATNMAQGSGMKRVSGTATRCNEFFPQVSPLSFILQLGDPGDRLRLGALGLLLCLDAVSLCG